MTNLPALPDMTRDHPKRFVAALNMLAAANHTTIDDANHEAYFEVLGSLPIGAVETTCGTMARRNSAFMPTAGEVFTHADALAAQDWQATMDAQPALPAPDEWAAERARGSENRLTFLKALVPFLGIDRVEVQMALTYGASTPSDRDEHIYIYNKYTNVPVPKITVPYVPISTESLGAGFDEFWHLYPRKTDKRRARGLWVKGKLAAEKLRVIEGLEGWLRVWELEKTQSKFIPYPSTFLNARRWEAVPEPTPELSRPTSTMIASTARFLDRHRGDK